MIFGLKESISYIVKSLPETKIEAYWLKDKILACVKIFHYCGFLVRVVICDNNFSNILAFHKIVATADDDNDSLYITIDMTKEEH